MSLPANVHVSSHPVISAKISALRQASSARDTRTLVTEISSLLAAWVSNDAFSAVEGPSQAISATSAEYKTVLASPSSYVLIPVLRSGLGMVDSFLSLLPSSETPVYHLGLFREQVSLSPVEYYNKLPKQPFDTAFVLDPLIATGGTAEAVISSLREWGVKKIYFVCVIASREGAARLFEELSAEEQASGLLELYAGAIDDEVSSAGYILPGVGDLGDRQNHTAHE